MSRGRGAVAFRKSRWLCGATYMRTRSLVCVDALQAFLSVESFVWLFGRRSVQWYLLPVPAERSMWTILVTVVGVSLPRRFGTVWLTPNDATGGRNIRQGPGASDRMPFLTNVGVTPSTIAARNRGSATSGLLCAVAMNASPRPATTSPRPATISAAPRPSAAATRRGRCGAHWSARRARRLACDLSLVVLPGG